MGKLSYETALPASLINSLILKLSNGLASTLLHPN